MTSNPALDMSLEMDCMEAQDRQTSSYDVSSVKNGPRTNGVTSSDRRPSHSNSNQKCDCFKISKELCDPCCGDNVRGLMECGHCIGSGVLEVGHFVKNTEIKDNIKDFFTLETVKSKLPILKWLPKYRFKHLQGDVIAGVAVGLTVLPQGLAYAKIAQLPPQYGLYTSFMGCYMYGIFGTSKDLSIGTTAVMSLLTGNFGFSPIDGDVTFAVALALMCGCIQIAMSLLHIGFIVDYVSHPVVHAFIQSAVLTIIWSQVKSWLGLTGIPREFFPQVIKTLQKLPYTRRWDFLLGFICMIALFLMKKMKLFRCGAPKNPSKGMKVFLYIVWLVSTARNAIVVITATGIAAAISVNQTVPFKLTGHIPPGLPPFRPPAFSVSHGNTTYTGTDILEKLGAGLAIIPIIGIVESVAIAKSFARKNKYVVDPNQELLALGIANLLGSFVSAYPVTASFSRSAVNGQSGVKTPAGQFITATMVVIVLAFATPVFYYIPDAALAAIIIMAVSDMFDYTPLIEMWEVKKIDLFIWLCTFVLGLVFGIETGIMIGVGLSVLVLLFPASRPGMQIDKQKDYTVVTLHQGFVYPSVEYFDDHIREKVIEDEETAKSERRAVILDFNHVTSLDSSTGQCLKNMNEDFTKLKCFLVLCNLRKNVMEVLDKCKIKDLHHTTTLECAISLAQRLRDPGNTIESDDEMLNITKEKLDENADLATLLIAEYNHMRSTGYLKEKHAYNSLPDEEEMLNEDDDSDNSHADNSHFYL